MPNEANNQTEGAGGQSAARAPVRKAVGYLVRGPLCYGRDRLDPDRALLNALEAMPEDVRANPPHRLTFEVFKGRGLQIDDAGNVSGQTLKKFAAGDLSTFAAAVNKAAKPATTRALERLAKEIRVAADEFAQTALDAGDGELVDCVWEIALNYARVIRAVAKVTKE